MLLSRGLLICLDLESDSCEHLTVMREAELKTLLCTADHLESTASAIPFIQVVPTIYCMVFVLSSHDCQTCKSGLLCQLAKQLPLVRQT